MKRLFLVLAVFAFLFVTGCQGRGSGSQTSAGSGSTSTAKEAPEFVQLVSEGKLPPLEQRLPGNPMVITPHERIGVYGGDWRVAQVGGHLAHVHRYQYYENLVKWTPGWGGIEPCVAESYEVSPDSREYTFHLREGMKWSDGEPFTTDDVAFWFNDFLMDTRLTPSLGNMWRQGDDPVKLEVMSKTSFKFVFAQPNGLFLQQLAQVGGLHKQYVPKHYYSKFHLTYNPNADTEGKAAGFGDWVAWLQSKGGPGSVEDVIYQNGDIPVINAWMWETPPGVGSATQAIADRNPYYWKVDTEGNQLPYLDRIVYDLLQDVEVLILKILNGEIDMMDQYFNLPANKTIIYENQQRGGYRLFETTPTEPNVAIIILNLCHTDPAMYDLFNNKDFRIGLSHALNRQEIIDIVYSGQGTPAQVAPRPGTEFYNEKLATQYTEYNVDLANAALDRAGLTGRDAQGFRLRQDGQRAGFTFELDVGRTEFVEQVQLIQQYFRAVGIDAQIRTMDRTLWELRVRTNWDFDSTIHRFGGGVGQSVLVDPRYFLPRDTGSTYAAAWGLWYTNPSGVGARIRPQEPPPLVKQALGIYDTLKITGDPATQVRLMNQILDIAAEQFYVIGILWDANGFGIVKNNFRNVPLVMPFSWEYPHPGPENPCQFFIDPAIR